MTIFNQSRSVFSFVTSALCAVSLLLGSFVLIGATVASADDVSGTSVATTEVVPVDETPVDTTVVASDEPTPSAVDESFTADATDTSVDSLPEMSPPVVESATPTDEEAPSAPPEE